MLLLTACDALPGDSHIVVKADEVAVVYAQNTGAFEKTLPTGDYTIDPLQGVVFYPLFWQVYTFRDGQARMDSALGGEAIDVPTSDNTAVRVSLSLVFRVNADHIDLIYDAWGADDYRVNYIRPTARRVVHDVLGLYTAADLAALAPSALQQQIETALRDELEANGFLLQRVDVGEVVSP